MRAKTRKPLSLAQLRVLVAIETSIEERGFPPTIREIGDVLGISSTNGVTDHLVRLARDGWIERDPFQSRAIRVLKPSKEAA